MMKKIEKLWIGRGGGGTFRLASNWGWDGVPFGLFAFVQSKRECPLLGRKKHSRTRKQASTQGRKHTPNIEKEVKPTDANFTHWVFLATNVSTSWSFSSSFPSFCLVVRKKIKNNSKDDGSNRHPPSQHHHH